MQRNSSSGKAGSPLHRLSSLTLRTDSRTDLVLMVEIRGLYEDCFATWLPSKAKESVMKGIITGGQKGIFEVSSNEAEQNTSNHLLARGRNEEALISH